MAAHVGHRKPDPGRHHYPFYPGDIRPRLQSVLAALADIDFALERNLEAIRKSETDEAQKREVVDLLRKRHQERRAPYLHELADLQRRIEAIFS
jgi:hypothetical protein